MAPKHMHLFVTHHSLAAHLLWWLRKKYFVFFCDRIPWWRALTWCHVRWRQHRSCLLCQTVVWAITAATSVRPELFSCRTACFVINSRGLEHSSRFSQFLCFLIYFLSFTVTGNFKQTFALWADFFAFFLFTAGPCQQNCFFNYLFVWEGSPYTPKIRLAMAS